MGRADALTPSWHNGVHPPLPRAELPVDTVSLDQYLIGKMLVRETAEGVASGRIVETDAYVVGAAAGHAYRGMTPRNRSLFLDRGHAYVCLVYGSAVYGSQFAYGRGGDPKPAMPSQAAYEGSKASGYEWSAALRLNARSRRYVVTP
jgi:hypothetical protein